MIRHRAQARRSLRAGTRLAAVGVSVVLLGSACGTPLPKLQPGQNPASYSGLDVSGDRIEYAIGKVTDIVEEELEASGIPGAAVAVVHAGQTELAEGFGVRDSSTGEEVDDRTVFPLAELSTPVSATVVAAETARGDVDWTTPVRDHLSWFALSDPTATAQVTVGDLFAHRSGLPADAGTDLESLGYDRPAVLHGLRHLPLGPFRASHAPTDHGVTAAAEAVAVSAGTRWDELGRQRVLGPLGMADSTYSQAEFDASDNRAAGHVRASGDSSDPTAEPGDWVPAEPERDPVARAGAGLSSSAHDMGRWMAMVLAGGRDPADTPVVPADALREALTPQSVAVPPASAADRPVSYGYGFELTTSSSGRVQWGHSGSSALGVGTSMLMMPSLDLGIVTLTNAPGSSVAQIINARFADLAQYGDPAVDWGELYAPRAGDDRTPVGELAGTRPPSVPRPPRAFDELTGDYTDSFFGTVGVRRAEDSLVLTVGPEGRVWPLEHWDGDVFAVSPVGELWPAGTRGAVVFDDDDTLTIELLDRDGQGVFTRADPEEDPDGA